MELFTSRYGFGEGIALSGCHPVGITRGAPKYAQWPTLVRLQLLAPDDHTWTAKNDRRRFTDRYLAQLRRLGFVKVEDTLLRVCEAVGNDRLVLLCFENVHEGKWCHRRMFALWWLEQTGVVIDELPETVPWVDPSEQVSLF